jgi:hypothetical protein
VQLLIHSRILVLRRQRVLLDSDIAELYEIETRALVQAVRRNLARFPEDFMFELSLEEFANLRSQFVISSGKHGGRRSAPYAFTEQGVAMLSSVLNSPQALAVNIEIMRTFVNIRRLTASNVDIARRLEELEAKALAMTNHHTAFRDNTQTQLRQVFEAIRQLMIPPDPAKRPIGFVAPHDHESQSRSTARTRVTG